jgi:hypothetical protein
MQRVLGTLEFDFRSTNAYGNKSYYDTSPSIFVTVTKSKFCLKLCVSSDPTNNKLSTKWKQTLITMESLSARLHSLLPDSYV